MFIVVFSVLEFYWWKYTVGS